MNMMLRMCYAWGIIIVIYGLFNNINVMIFIGGVMIAIGSNRKGG